MDWRHRDSCRDEDPELFLPVGNAGPALRQGEEARPVCRRCPVREKYPVRALQSSLSGSTADSPRTSATISTSSGA